MNPPAEALHGARAANTVGVTREVQRSSLLPKEHGAYGQIAFPLATAFVVAGVSTAGLLLAAAVVAGFLAHEPAAVLLGLRGARPLVHGSDARRKAVFQSIYLRFICAATIPPVSLMQHWIVPGAGVGRNPPEDGVRRVMLSCLENGWQARPTALTDFEAALPISPGRAVVPTSPCAGCAARSPRSYSSV